MKRIVFALLGIALLLTSPVAAQEDAPALSADDAALLAAADAAPPDSFAFDYTAHLAIDLDTFMLTSDLSGSGAVDRTVPALALSLDGSIALGTTQTIPVSDQFRWVGDTLYLNAGDGWQSRQSAGQIAADFVSQYAFLSADAGALSGWDWTGIDGLSDVLNNLRAADPAAWLTTQRLDDEAVNDAQTAHFQTTADLHALMQTGAFADALTTLANAEGTMLMIYDHDQMADIAKANSAMFTGATVTLEQYVGLDDHLLHRVVLTVDMPIDPTQGGYPNAPFTANAVLDITLHDLNQPQDISAPDGAQPVDSFAFPAAPTPAPPGDGKTQYVFFDTISTENEPYTRTFDAQAGDVVTITASGLQLEADTQITLLAPDGSTLAENDDRDTPSFALGDYESQIADFAIPADGTYSVQVNDPYGGTGTYLLTINIQR